MEALKRDAERWRALSGAARMRLLGTANFGSEDMHLGLEIWGAHFNSAGSDKALEALTTFADVRRKISGGYCMESLSLPDAARTTDSPR
jgi:hypothetical protein